METTSAVELVAIAPTLELGDADTTTTTAVDTTANAAASYPVGEEQRGRAMTFSPTMLPVSPSILTFSNIVVAIKGKHGKHILNDVSGSITGGFWAIMGASGGGKTTLLSTLSLRLDTNYMDITGEFRLNGREYSRHDLKAMSAYVMQDDLLHADLTVYDTLYYAAQLRMSDATTLQRQERVDELMVLMGINQCRDVIIGDSRHKGISGGQRKRVSIAMELVNRPKLLFLDEPTSGLDSSTALLVCEALKRLTQLGECTVVCTIHQPQPKIFDLFDNLILMKKGTIVYQGPAFKTEAFLEKMGFPLPDDMAIADHLLDVISPTNEDHEAFANEVNRKKIVPVNLSLGIEKELNMTLLNRSWIEQFGILLARCFSQYRRNSSVILLSFAVSVLLAVFIGLGLWNQIGTTQTSIPLRVPSLFFICVTQGILGSLQSLNSFPSERAIMLRERQAGAYCVSSYFAAKTVVDLLTQMWPTFVFCCIVYPLVGYRPGADHFFLFSFFICLNSLAAVSLATLVTCVCMSVELSTVVLSFGFEWCRLWGGFFASPTQMAEVPHWKFADALSFMKYSFVGISLNELTDLDLSCGGATTCVTSGNDIIIANGYDQYTIGYCIGILIVYIVCCRLLAYLALRFIKI